MFWKLLLFLTLFGGYSVYAYRSAQWDRAIKLDAQVENLQQSVKAKNDEIASLKKDFGDRWNAQEKGFAALQQKQLESLILVVPEQTEVIKRVFAPATQPSTQPTEGMTVTTKAE